MLAIRQRYGNALELTLGAHRKRGPRYLRLKGPAGTEKIGLNKLRDGLEILGLFSISLAGAQLQLVVPAGSRVSYVNLFGNTSIWDGQAAALAQAMLPLRVPENRSILIEIDGRQWLLALAFEKPARVTGTAFSLRPMLVAVWSMLQSGLFHASLVVAISMLSTGFRLPWLASERAQDEQERVSAVEKTVPIEMIASPDSDFNGRGLVQAAAVDVAQVQQQKEQKMANKISDLVAKMSKVALGSIGKVADTRGGSEANSAMQSLANRMGQGRRTDLKENFKFVAQGTAGKDSRWDMYGDGAKQVSAKDLEQISDVFRSLQEQFRGCYEAALLKYEALSVSVQYESEVSESGHLGEAAFNISGKSDGESETALKGCLSKVLHRVSLSKNLSGLRIRNQFVFRS